MGKLRITKNGVILEGPAEFVKTLKAKYITTRQVSGIFSVPSFNGLTATLLSLALLYVVEKSLLGTMRIPCRF